MEETICSTKNPIDFAENKAKKVGFTALDALEKSFFCLGKMMVE